jgi:predicted secreted protein
VDAGCRILCLDAEDDGATVELATGHYVVVVLTTNASTGYAWHLEALDDQVLRSLCSGSVPQSPLDGAPADLKWFFEGAEPGDTELVLEYYRPWEGPDTAVDSFTLNVVVH